jgi:hypothetical protein
MHESCSLTREWKESRPDRAHVRVPFAREFGHHLGHDPGHLGVYLGCDGENGGRIVMDYGFE